MRGAVSSSGLLTATTAYDAWGNPETSGGLTTVTPFGYADGYTDPDGLIYLLNRYYDPATGQFTSRDPLVGQTLEPYAYASGDPVASADPTGMSPGDWQVKGHGCAKDRSGQGFKKWCDLKLGLRIVDSFLDVLARLSVRISVDPGRTASRVNYNTFYYVVPGSGVGMTNVHIDAYALCYRNREECGTDVVWPRLNASDYFYLYTFNRMSPNSRLGAAFTLAADAINATPRHKTVSYRTAMALCKRTDGMQRLLRRADGVSLGDGEHRARNLEIRMLRSVIVTY